MNKQPIRVVEGNAKPFEAFWQVRDAAQTGGEPEIAIHGPISEFSWLGDEVTPAKFKADLYAVGQGGPITIKMHSGGGDVFAAAAIRAMLSDYPGQKTVVIEGLCASAAVNVALAANKVRIHDTAYMMVHNPSYSLMFASLDADTLEAMANTLRVVKDGLLNGYESRTGKSREELSAMLDAETWMTAQQAVENGFADEVISGGAKTNPNDIAQAVRNFANVPAALLNYVNEPEASTDEPGQEPAPEPAPAEEAPQERPNPNAERLAAVQAWQFQGETRMNIRDLLKKRADLVAAAQGLNDAADAEGRDLNEQELADFTAALDEAEGLTAQIKSVEERQARLRAAAESVAASTNEPQKPEATESPKVMKRSEWQALDANARAAYLKNGGKLED